MPFSSLRNFRSSPAFALPKRSKSVGPFAPATIAHTAIMRISRRGYLFLLSILKSTTDESASSSESGFFRASAARCARRFGSVSIFPPFPA